MRYSDLSQKGKMQAIKARYAVIALLNTHESDVSVAEHHALGVAIKAWMPSEHKYRAYRIHEVLELKGESLPFAYLWSFTS